MAVIDIQPPVLDLTCYAGDGFEFTLTCVDNAGTPINLNGTLEAQIKTSRVIDEIVTSFTVDIVNAMQGILVLSLSGTQTQDLIPLGKTKFAGVWDLQWTFPGAQPRTIVQGTVGCGVDVTR